MWGQQWLPPLYSEPLCQAGHLDTGLIQYLSSPIEGTYPEETSAAATDPAVATDPSSHFCAIAPTGPCSLGLDCPCTHTRILNEIASILNEIAINAPSKFSQDGVQPYSGNGCGQPECLKRTLSLTSGALRRKLGKES